MIVNAKAINKFGVVLLYLFTLSACNVKSSTDESSVSSIVNGETNSTSTSDYLVPPIPIIAANLTPNPTIELPTDEPTAAFGSLSVGIRGLGVSLLTVSNENDTTGSSTLIAATQVVKGRVVAFSGQGFLTGDKTNTLLGNPTIADFIANSAAWASKNQSENLASNILVDNEVIKESLINKGFNNVSVASQGDEVSRWANNTLSNYDLLVIVVNERGGLRLKEKDIFPVIKYLINGGGLLIAGSASHWDWWISKSKTEIFPGNLLLSGFGITWNSDVIEKFPNAKFNNSMLNNPRSIWKSYITSQPIADEHLLKIPQFLQDAINSELTNEVNAGLQRLVSEAPALPVIKSNIQAQIMAKIATTIPPYNWPTPHPWSAVFPGSVEPGVPTINKSYSVALSKPQCQHLGVYAPPGKVVQISISPTLINQNIEVQVGDPYDDLNAINDITEWKRAPSGLMRVYPLNQPQINVGNVFGGSICITGAKDVARPAAYTARVQVIGAVEQPVYIHGVTRIGTWKAVELLKKAPRALLIDPDKISMSVSTEALRNVFNVNVIMDFWRKFYISHNDLLQGTPDKPFRSLFIFDTQVGWGYANANPERLVFPIEILDIALLRNPENKEFWAFGHELGHQFQTSNWTGCGVYPDCLKGGLSEVGVNLFTTYTLNKVVNKGGNFETRGFLGFNDTTLDHAQYKNYRWTSGDLFVMLKMYQELIYCFGWDKIKEVFRSYYLPTYDKNLDGLHFDGFAIRLSKIVQKDLTGFFTNWEYPISETAIQRIKSFGYPEWLPPGW